MEEGYPPYRCVATALIPPKPASKGTEAAGNPFLPPLISLWSSISSPRCTRELVRTEVLGPAQTSEQKLLTSLHDCGECSE